MVKNKGENHYNWKGDKVGYYGIHVWLDRTFGNAIKCESELVGLKCKGKSKNFNWSLLKGKEYQRKRENFIQLCLSCHRFYDMTDEWRKNNSLANKGRMPWNKGKKATPEMIEKNRLSHIGQKPWNKGLKFT